MSEFSPRGSEHTSLTITHDEALTHPQLRQRYTDERVDTVKSGVPVWVIHGIEGQLQSANAITYSFYYEGLMRGYVEGNDLDGYEVYWLELVEGEFVPRHLNMEPVDNLSEAQKKLSDYITEHA